MPELPEVETTLRGLKPHIIGQQIINVVVRFPTLRWPIPENLKKLLIGQTIQAIERRGKYILLKFHHGTLILHLGMSGRTKILLKSMPAQKHDHVDISFKNKKILRFTDPRRFGAILWTEGPPERHELLSSLGPEPLSRAFHADYLWQKSRGKKRAIKTFIMDGQVVTGVGNIYATEALFAASINPNRESQKVTRSEFVKLCTEIKTVLKRAIKKGGTTLRDFSNTAGKPGYFIQNLAVYGRQGEPCLRCGKILKMRIIGQRSSVYCPGCQK